MAQKPKGHLFKNISLLENEAENGDLKLLPLAYVWISTKTQKKKQIPLRNIKEVYWYPFSRGSILKVLWKTSTKNEEKEKEKEKENENQNQNQMKETSFFGFQSNHYNFLRKYILDYHKMDLKKVEMATQGLNCGDIALKENSLYFYVNGKPAFDFPLKNVSQSILQSKNDLTLVLSDKTHENSKVDSLSQIRFFVPLSYQVPSDPNPDGCVPNGYVLENTKEKTNVETGLGAILEPKKILKKTTTQNNEIFTAEQFDKEIRQITDASVTGDEIVSFKDIFLFSPRGRYKIQCYPTYFKLSGTTYNWRIEYKSITEMFMLPKPDAEQAFVIVLDAPIQRGKTKYSHLIFQTFDTKEIEVELNLTESEIQEKYHNKICKDLTGFQSDIIKKVFRVLIKKPIQSPHKFKTSEKTPWIHSSFKTSEGFLYLLENGLFFIHKSIHIKYSDIATIDFSRLDHSHTASQLNILNWKIF
ncbi:fact complex subunit ssrp1 [Anaeramoeba ignava]|uniref:FACT complex subunit SSRP1 n=1 Tax=Anaeramoeba ignava TaxID=1746090 RepID=A0A9Q0RGW3_ANAIG|nr:fact complex subunit ssrp1 [Anaeramoeba ignava]